MEKLKKEYKKTGAEGAAVLELWNLLAGHLQAIVEANSSQLDYLSRYCEDACNLLHSLMHQSIPALQRVHGYVRPSRA